MVRVSLSSHADISFWKNRKSVEGISVQSLLMNFVFQVIIFLYLLDNETSWVILISAGVGLAIEAWKIQKAVRVEWDPSRWWFPLRLHDRETYSQRTKEFDQQAFRYLGWASIPLVFGYSIYSLTYNTHKNWYSQEIPTHSRYSWILASLTGFVYTFGFIMMTPQL